MTVLLPYDGPEIATVTAEFLLAIRGVMDDLPGTVVSDAEHMVRYMQVRKPGFLESDRMPIYDCHATVTFVVTGMEPLNIENLFHRINEAGMEGRIEVLPGSYEIRMSKRYVK